MSAQVTIEQLSKQYGNYVALKSVDIRIEQGEFVVLLGPSGCGKSTLLRMIAGLEVITDGAISIDDAEVNNVHPRDRNIAMVFQDYALYPHMSVRKNLAYPLRLAKAPKAEIAAAVDRVARMLELEPLLERKPSQLSGGQRQRVAMGRALVREPAVFLMDEPLSNLDARLRQQMRVGIRDLQHRLGITTIYVTHDQVEAMTMADKIVVMNGGSVMQIGTPHEIYTTPANRFVASFVGSPPMNFIERPSLVSQIAPASMAGHDIAVGIRPEALTLSADVPADVRLRGKCRVTEILGSETLCHVDLIAPEGGSDTIIAKIQGEHGGLEGQDVDLGLKMGAANYFDRNSGERLQPSG